MPGCCKRPAFFSVLLKILEPLSRSTKAQMLIKSSNCAGAQQSTRVGFADSAFAFTLKRFLTLARVLLERKWLNGSINQHAQTTVRLIHHHDICSSIFSLIIPNKTII
jgi:hypothetical protein